MKRQAIKIIRYLLVLLLLFTMTLSLLSCTKNDVEVLIEGFEKDTSVEAAVYTSGERTLKVGKEVFDLNHLYDEYYYSISNLLVVLDGYLYGVDKTTNNEEKEFQQTIEIFRYDLKRQIYEPLYVGDYCSYELTEKYLCPSYARVTYNDGEITIFDQRVTTVFNIYTHEAVNLPPEDYVYHAPKYEISQKDESGFSVYDRVTVTTQTTEERILTVEYMAARSTHIKQIYEFEADKTLFSVSDRFENIFDDVTVVGDTIYITCDIYVSTFDSNYLFFSYDYESDTFKLLETSDDYLTWYAIPIANAIGA